MALFCTIFASNVNNVVYAEKQHADGIDWEVVAGTLIITPNTEYSDASKIGVLSNYHPWNSYSNSITALAIETGVIDLGGDNNYAFTYLNKLKSISISDTVVSIGSRVFLNLGVLESITVDSENNIFSSLDENGEECNCLINKSTKTVLLCAKNSVIPQDSNLVTKLATYAFYGRSNLTTIDIPPNITSMSCERWTGLKELVIPDTVSCVTVSFWNFYYCRNLENLTLPKSTIKFKDEVEGGVTKGAFHHSTKATITITSTDVEHMVIETNSLQNVKQIKVNNQILNAFKSKFPTLASKTVGFEVPKVGVFVDVLAPTIFVTLLAVLVAFVVKTNKRKTCLIAK